MTHSSRAGFVPVVLILVVVGLVAIGGGAYWYWQSKGNPSVSSVGQSISQEPESPIQPKMPSSKFDTADWKTHSGKEIPLSPYNFIFRYPKDFSEGVDIGAVILIPNKYAKSTVAEKVPKMIISAFPIVNEKESELSTERQLAKLCTAEKDCVLTGEKLKVGKYNAVELTFQVNPDEVVWFFSTYPDQFSQNLAGARNIKATTLLAPLRVAISSTLRSDKSIPAGTDEAIISTIVLPSADISP